MTRLFTAAVAASVLSALVATTSVLAAGEEPASQPRQGPMDDHHGAMMGQMTPEQLTQMARMMENCHRKMDEAHARANPSGEPAPAPHR